MSDYVLRLCVSTDIIHQSPRCFPGPLSKRGRFLGMMAHNSRSAAAALHCDKRYHCNGVLLTAWRLAYSRHFLGSLGRRATRTVLHFWHNVPCVFSTRLFFSLFDSTWLTTQGIKLIFCHGLRGSGLGCGAGQSARHDEVLIFPAYGSTKFPRKKNNFSTHRVWFGGLVGIGA